MKSLKGYRIGTLVDYDCMDSMNENYAGWSYRQKWKNIKKDQVILKLPIYQHAPRLVQKNMHINFTSPTHNFHMNRIYRLLSSESMRNSKLGGMKKCNILMMRVLH